MKTLIFTLAYRQNQVSGFDLGFLIWINWFDMDFVQQWYRDVCNGLGELWVSFWCNKVCLGWIVRFTSYASKLTCKLIHSWYRLMGSLLSDCCMMGLGFDFSCKLVQARIVIWFSWVLMGYLMCKLCNDYMSVFVMHRGSLCWIFTTFGTLWGESRDSPKIGLIAPNFVL